MGILRHAAFCAALFASELARAAQAPCVPLTDDLDVTGDVAICPGTYDVTDAANDGVLRVRASNVTIDFQGAVLQSNAMNGWGIRSDGFSNVTIVNATIRGFRAAVLIQGGGGHRVEGCTLSDNRKRGVTHTAADFLDIWPDFNGQVNRDQIGDGVVLVSCTSSVVRNNVMKRQQNGIGLFQCDHVELSGNDCSDNQGWGIHLRRSSFNVIVGNTADNCFNTVSTYCHDVQQDGCDTAAFLIIKNSNDNLVQQNSLRNSGDGVFSAARQSSTHWGADRNVYIGNDVSLSKHIGLEATFTDANEFLGNVANACGRYGMWLGYSKNATVRGNTFHGCAWAGISNESTQSVLYEENDVRGCPIGVELRRGTFNLLQQDSQDQTFRKNHVVANTGRGFSIVDTHRVTIETNEIRENGGGNLYFGKVQEPQVLGPLHVHQNNLLGFPGIPFHVWNEQSTPVDLTSNWWGTTDPAVIQASIRGLADLGIFPPHRIPRLEITFTIGGDGPFTLRRVVNERADDATDCLVPARRAGNAFREIWLGRSRTRAGDLAYITGLRFKDVYVPPNATVSSARIVFTTGGPYDYPLALEIAAEAALDAQPFEHQSMPRTRGLSQARVPWSVVEHWDDGGSASTPELKTLVDELLAQPGWTSGNAMAFLVRNTSPHVAARAIWAFEREGYATLPSTPYEFRRYRKHRFAKLEVEYQSRDGFMALERELGAGSDDADTAVGLNEVHVGFLGAPLSGGFRFPDVKIPLLSQLRTAKLWMPTDGTYTNPLSLAIRGEALLFPPPYSGANLPATRPNTAASIPWSVTSTWTFLQWHATPDVVPILAEIMAMQDWQTGTTVAFDVEDQGSSGHRRVWGFERNPRVTPHDFPEVGATPFTPFLTAPVVF